MAYRNPQFFLNIRARKVPTRGDYEREWAERAKAWKDAEDAEANRRANELLDRFLTDMQRNTWHRGKNKLGTST